MMKNNGIIICDFQSVISLHLLKLALTKEHAHIWQWTRYHQTAAWPLGWLKNQTQWLTLG